MCLLVSAVNSSAPSCCFIFQGLFWLPCTSNINFFIVNSVGKLSWVVMVCQLTSHGYFTIRLLLHRKVKLLKQMNDLYQWCRRIPEANFLPLSLLTLGEPVYSRPLFFWRIGDGCIRASNGLFAWRELPKSKESYEVRFHLFSINDELISVQGIAYFHLDWRFKLVKRAS